MHYLPFKKVSLPKVIVMEFDNVAIVELGRLNVLTEWRLRAPCSMASMAKELLQEDRTGLLMVRKVA